MAISESSRHRRVMGMFLLSLLAVCGYLGTMHDAVQTVSVPVSRIQYEGSTPVLNSVESASERLNHERVREMELLKRVADSEDSDAVLRQDALEQIAQVAERMEVEARVQACLTEMGIKRALPVSGAQGMTIICPEESIEGNADRLRIIDAVCSVSGYEARDIKIILTKN